MGNYLVFQSCGTFLISWSNPIHPTNRGVPPVHGFMWGAHSSDCFILPHVRCVAISWIRPNYRSVVLVLHVLDSFPRNLSFYAVPPSTWWRRALLGDGPRCITLPLFPRWRKRTKNVSETERPRSTSSLDHPLPPQSQLILHQVAWIDDENVHNVCWLWFYLLPR